jgi:hypothetical protein
MPLTERGITLLSVLFALAASLMLTAALFFSFFVDALAVSNGSAGDDALYVAEAGIQHLWSLLEPAPDFARELSWTSGEPPFGAVVGFPEPPRTYRVRVAPLPDGSLAATSEGTSHRGTRRRVEAVFLREARFRPPAALTIAAAGILNDSTGTLDVSTAEAERNTPALGAEGRREADSVSAARGDGTQVAVVGPTGLGDAAQRLLGAAGVSLDGPQAGGEWGSEESPALVRLGGLSDLSGVVRLTGIAIADGPLEIHGRLEIDGLLLAPQGTEVSGDLIVHGAAWLGGEVDILSSATLSVAYSPTALDVAALVGGETLPRAPILGAWREVW